MLISVAHATKPPRYWKYFKEAGEKYGLDPKILVAIGMCESSLNCKAIKKKNRNKSIDVGVMQINSWWFPTLKKSAKDLNLLYSPRYNIHVGAWIFKKCTKMYGVSWRAIDCYNKGAKKARHNSKYIRMVNKKYSKIKYLKYDE